MSSVSLFIVSLLTNLFSQGENYYHNPLHEYKINESMSIDYIKSYESNLENVESNLENVEPNLRFSTGFDSKYIIDTIEDTHHNETICELACNVEDRCMGFMMYYNDSDICNCNLLSNISSIAYTNIESKSFKKIIIHHSPLDEFVIFGIVLSPEIDIKNITVYIDLNLNGLLDPGEPFNHTYEDYFFDFYGLDKGSYSIRMIEPDGCYQLFPGYMGYERYYEGDGYIDYVTYFSDGGNRYHHGVQGGIIDLDENILAELDFILGDNESTYLSFYDNYSIIVTITDEVIVDNPGDDIFIDIYGNSLVNANVSVSNDGLNFIYLGILNDTNTNYDLEDINFTIPVRFIRLNFFCNMTTQLAMGNKMVPRNIVKIYGIDDIYYSPPFAYYIDSDLYFAFFIYECGHYFSCETYCYYKINNTIGSCEFGCSLFNTTKNCDCLSYYENNTQNGFNIPNYNINHCQEGCAYEMGKYVYPNYTVFNKAVGLESDTIWNNVNCNTCFDEIINNCTYEDSCQAVSLNNKDISTQYSFRHFFKENSYFLAKNSILDGESISYLTTTQTTSKTTSPTTSKTTSKTTSPTTSQTTSKTTSQTTSKTTSKTTSPTTSATTSPTTSATTSETTSATTSPTTSATTSETTSATTSPTTSATTSPTTSATTSETILINNEKSSGMSTDIMITIICILTVFVIGLIFYLIINSRKKNKDKIKYSRPTPSYDNPLYQTDPNNRALIYSDMPDNPTISLQPNDENDENEEDYLDVKPSPVRDFLNEDTEL